MMDSSEPKSQYGSFVLHQYDAFVPARTGTTRGRAVALAVFAVAAVGLAALSVSSGDRHSQQGGIVEIEAQSSGISPMRLPYCSCAPSANTTYVSRTDLGSKSCEHWQSSGDGQVSVGSAGTMTLDACKAACDNTPDCRFITWYENNGCRTYTSCVNPVDDVPSVTKYIYERQDVGSCTTQSWKLKTNKRADDLKSTSKGYMYHPSQIAWPSTCSAASLDPNTTTYAANWTAKQDCCKASCVLLGWCKGIVMGTSCNTTSTCFVTCHLLSPAEAITDYTNTSAIAGDWHTLLMRTGRYECPRANTSRACIDPVSQTRLAAGVATTECRQLVGPDNCVPGACLNGGVCVDGNSGYTCSCLPGWIGNRCDQPTYVTYTLIIRSRLESTAGTVNPIYIKIHGEFGLQTREHKAVDSNKLANNATVAFTMFDRDVGVPSAVTFRVAGGDEAFLDYIEVVHKGETYITPNQLLPTGQWHVPVTVLLMEGDAKTRVVNTVSDAQRLAAAAAFVQGNLTINGLNPEYFFTDPTMEIAMKQAIAAATGMPISSIVLTVVGATAPARRLAESVSAATRTGNTGLTLQFQIVMTTAELNARGASVIGNFTQAAGGTGATDATGASFLNSFRTALLGINPDSAVGSMYLTASVEAAAHIVPIIPIPCGCMNGTTAAVNGTAFKYVNGTGTKVNSTVVNGTAYFTLINATTCDPSTWNTSSCAVNGVNNSTNSSGNSSR